MSLDTTVFVGIVPATVYYIRSELHRRRDDQEHAIDSHTGFDL